ncbi:MAG: hypothetical protein ACLR1R_04955 [Ruminococcus callidus]
MPASTCRFIESGKSWESTKPREEAKNTRICPDCGTGNPEDATHCSHCGKPFLRPEEQQERHADAPRTVAASRRTHGQC